MKGNQTRLALQIAGLIASLAVLSGCGSNSQPRDSSSAEVVAGYNGVTLSDGSTGTQCTGFTSSSGLAGKITTSYVNGQLQQDQIRLRLTGLVNAFDSNANLVLKMYRWKADTNSSVSIDSTPLNFVVQGSSSTAVSSSMNQLTASTITTLRSQLSVSGSSSADFLANTTVLVNGVDYTWDALKIAVYDGSTVVGSVDVLLPIFAANPNVFASNHGAVLAQIHPLYASRSQSQADSQWLAQLSTYCF